MSRSWSLAVHHGCRTCCRVAAACTSTPGLFFKGTNCRPPALTTHDHINTPVKSFVLADQLGAGNAAACCTGLTLSSGLSCGWHARKSTRTGRRSRGCSIGAGGCAGEEAEAGCPAAEKGRGSMINVELAPGSVQSKEGCACLLSASASGIASK